MRISHLIWHNLRKNLSNYYLYVFALIFSSALYFAFITLQYDPSLSAATSESIKGAAGMKTAAVMIMIIVAIFLMYANNLFIKRRGREIGLFQLIGLTKREIFNILSLENLILYYGSLVAGIVVGFSFSKLIMMVLLKTMGVETVASLHFSEQALFQTLIIFSIIYLLIMLMNGLFIRRQTILSLFRVTSSTEEKIRGMSFWQIMNGILGLVLIVGGYGLSTRLFNDGLKSVALLFILMITILVTVILGTYFFYKGSVSLISNLIRKRKNGHVGVADVVSLTSVMFKMKSNAFLLTVISTVSALAIGLLSLSYISYYSAEKNAINRVPDDFSFVLPKDAQTFEKALKQSSIPYKKHTIHVVEAYADISGMTESIPSSLHFDPHKVSMTIVSEKDLNGIHLKSGTTILTGYNDEMRRLLPLKNSGQIVFKTTTGKIPLHFIGIHNESLVPGFYMGGNFPAAIVTPQLFKELTAHVDPTLKNDPKVYTEINLVNPNDQKDANAVFNHLGFDNKGEAASQHALLTTQKKNAGLIMFIVGFMGLTFLITSGCILYFKQMDESESEKHSYTILRKLGFTEHDLLRGVLAKQLFSFGIPLAIGLLHSYFAIKSGWFLFGSEHLTPMLIVMVLYTLLYSIFGTLSLLNYKKVIREAL